MRAAAEAAEAAEAEPPLRWFEFCRKYVAGRWRTSAAKTREGMADGLAAVSSPWSSAGMAFPQDEQLRLAFRWGIVPANAGEDPPAELKAAYDWLTTADRPVLEWPTPKCSKTCCTASGTSWTAPRRRATRTGVAAGP